MRRGQAFEVFRLLIAAVVAGAILMVLLNVLNIIKPPSTNPKDAVKTLIQSYIDTGGGNGQEVEFQQGEIIDVRGIAMSLGLSPDAVCVYYQGASGVTLPTGIQSQFRSTLCSSTPSSTFVCHNGKDDKTIVYQGSSRRFKAKIYVYCGQGVCRGASGISCAVTVLPR